MASILLTPDTATTSACIEQGQASGGAPGNMTVSISFDEAKVQAQLTKAGLANDSMEKPVVWYPDNFPNWSPDNFASGYISTTNGIKNFVAHGVPAWSDSLSQANNQVFFSLSVNSGQDTLWVQADGQNTWVAPSCQ